MISAGIAAPVANAIVFTQIVGPTVSLPAGIAYQPAANGQPACLTLSHSVTETASVPRFARMDLNAAVTIFGPPLATGNANHNLSKELKMLGIRVAAGGFVPGEVYTSDGSTANILRLTQATGGTETITTVPLVPPPGGYVRGFAHDETGAVVGGDLICVTSAGKVVRVTYGGITTVLNTITMNGNPVSVEAALVIPNNPATYGTALAGKILVGAEDPTGNGCWVVNPTSPYTVTPLNLAIPNAVPPIPADLPTEDLDIIRPGESLYASDNAQGAVSMIDASLNLFAGFENQILITQEFTGQLRKLRYSASGYSLPTADSIQIVQPEGFVPAVRSGAFEHVTFAPPSLYVAPRVSIKRVSGSITEGGDTSSRFHVTRETVAPWSLGVVLTLSGTAAPTEDYWLQYAQGGSPMIPVTPTQNPQTGLYEIALYFEPEKDRIELEVFAHQDNVPEDNELLTLTVVPRAFVVGASPRYQPASSPNNQATTTIFEAGSDVVDLLPTDLIAGEALSGSAAKGVVSLFRSSSVGEVTIGLALGGSATFGVDYLAKVFLGSNSNPEEGFDGSVTLPDGVSSARIEIVPIDDSRVENNETVILSVATGVGYRPGMTATQTVTIADGEDTNQLPVLGYWLAELGPIGSTSTYAYGLNTIPDGYGGYRAKVVGNALPASGQSGFRWDNGVSILLGVPSAWGLLSGAKSSSTFALNDAGTSVGQCVLYNAGAYTNVAAYWAPTATTATPLTGLYTGNGLDDLAQDINQRNVVNGISVGGLIVGQSKRADGKIHAVVWIPSSSGVYGNAVDLKDLGDQLVAKNSYANAINDQAQVVGRSQIVGLSNYHGFVTRSALAAGQWSPIELNFQVDDMGTATGNETDTSEFNDLNNLGEIVGRGHTASGQMRALYKAPGTGRHAGFSDLKVLGDGTANAGTESVANSISANGVIVGMSKVKVGANQVWQAFVTGNVGNPGSQPLLNLNDHAYLYTGSGTPPVLASGQGWTLVSAERINRRGWIVGYGTKSGQSRAFVLSPR